MIGFGALMAAAIGTGTFVDGLACTPTAPASMSVNIGQGSITTLETVDPNAYSTLGTNNAALVKMGINVSATPFSLAGLVPGTPGQSVNVLIEAAFLEVDTEPLILPYFNPTPPNVPLSGPNNSGTAQNTRRDQIVNLQLKSGYAGTTGAQNTPAPDAGYAPLWIITLNYGQSTITSANIQLAPNAPYIGTKLGQLPRTLTSNLTLYVTPTGNDANNGLSTSSAFATIQAAWNALVVKYNLNGYGATINVAGGQFAPVVCSGMPAGFSASSFINITGDGAPTVITSTGGAFCITANDGANVAVSNMTLNGTGGLQVYGGSVIANAGGIYFGTMTGGNAYHQLANGGLLTGSSPYTITGSAGAHLATINGGSLQFYSAALTLVGTPAFSLGFAYAASGNMVTGGMTFNGTATGPKFAVQLGGSINTASGNINFFPGSSAGTYGSGTNIGFYA